MLLLLPTAVIRTNHKTAQLHTGIKRWIINPTCFLRRQFSEFQKHRFVVLQPPGTKNIIAQINAPDFNPVSYSRYVNDIKLRHIQAPLVRYKSFDFNRKGDSDNPVKKANWWTKWKRRTTREYQNSAERSRTTMMYMWSLVILTVGASYAAVPLYRVFCQTSGYGGTTSVGHDSDKVETMETEKDRLITIKFNADTAATMQWNFRPQQPSIDVYAGETALAFYTAKNPTDKPIDGISTYNVIPFEAGQYFNKIQCFCFEEQRLNPKEEVDMPVFFYIDPEFVQDPFLEDVDTIYLSYTFFESRPGLELPVFQQPQKR